MSEQAKKLILAVAVLILCIVWGRNLVLLDDASQAVLGVHPPEAGTSKGTVSDEVRMYEYREGNRDPFEVPVTFEHRNLRQQAGLMQNSEPLPTPRAACRGIVWNKRRPQVIVFDSSSSAIRIMRHGDTVNGFVISSISLNEILLRKGRHRIVWQPNKTTQ